MTIRATHFWLVALFAPVALVASGCESAQAPASVNQPAAVAAAEASGEAAASESSESSDASAGEPNESDARAAASTTAAPQNITFDTIKFPLEKNADYQRSLLTPAIEALHGRPVRVRGFILPSFQQSGITQFVLVRDNQQCCFGPGAALYDCVVVDMKPGKTAEFTTRPVAVEGTFELRDFLGPDGKYLAIYHLDGDSVRP